MVEVIGALMGVALLVVVALQLWTLRQVRPVDLSTLEGLIRSTQGEHERTERGLRDEIRQNREELRVTLRDSSDSMNRQLLAFGTSSETGLATVRHTLTQELQEIQSTTTKHLEQLRESLLLSAKTQRDELATAVRDLQTLISQSLADNRSEQHTSIEAFGVRLDGLTQTVDGRMAAMGEGIDKRLTAAHTENGAQLAQMRQEGLANAERTRIEVNTSVRQFGDTTQQTLAEMGGTQRATLSSVVEQLSRLTDTNDAKLEAQRVAVDERLKQIQSETAQKLDQMREEANVSSKGLREEVGHSVKGFNDSLLAQVSSMTELNQQKLETLKNTVEEHLKSLGEKNEQKLEQMRATVDEKLQGTLEKRLGESFKQVSDRLEEVHKGLGEMQVLATGVGDLKKVLSNVKTRGIWGETQLGALLEQVMRPEQYATNVDVKKNGEQVEYAIRLPGGGDGPLWLPIDAKFPFEDYQRLVDAQQAGDPVAAEVALKQLDTQMRKCAQDIFSKYVQPPDTTDFAIMFLPTEGLFAEVMNRIGLAEQLRDKFHVMVTGPTTLYALLNSLQMGFRTLAIQQRSSEVWAVLGAVKTEFGKYGDLLGGVKKKLQTAANAIDDVEIRARAISRRLKDVEALPVPQAGKILALEGAVALFDGNDEDAS